VNRNFNIVRKPYKK